MPPLMLANPRRRGFWVWAGSEDGNNRKNKTATVARFIDFSLYLFCAVKTESVYQQLAKESLI